MCATRPGVFRALALLVLCGSGNHEAARAGLATPRRSFRMCDYSLQTVRSRPARVGDELTTRDSLPHAVLLRR